jgi:isocitrate dehydrogenase kinase/phosphatase
LLGDPAIRGTLLELHPDLFEPAFWQGLKERILSGYIEDVFPYSDAVRFDANRLVA